MPKTDTKADAFTKEQKRKLAGYKATISNEKASDEAKVTARKMIERIEKDEKFETVGDRVHGRERNKAQELKDEKFETIGDRVRSRTEFEHGLVETKSQKRIAAGLKASLKNKNTSAERKKEIIARLKELGEDVSALTGDEPTIEDAGIAGGSGEADEEAPAADEEGKEGDSVEATV